MDDEARAPAKAASKKTPVPAKAKAKAAAKKIPAQAKAAAERTAGPTAVRASILEVINGNAVRAQPAQGETDEYAKITPDLALLTGYLGSSTELEWYRLYRDRCFGTWWLINRGSVLYRATYEEPYSPLTERDALWLRADAKVGNGRTQTLHESLGGESQYLDGEFIRADEAMQADAASYGPGVFNDAVTAGCCKGIAAVTSSKYKSC
jgi:hypothetical protein